MAPVIPLTIAAVVITVSIIAIVVLLNLPAEYTVFVEGPDGKPIRAPIHVQILVLGDIGRSPRMQYHALSIARHGGRVDLIGYRESEVHPDIVSNPLIRITTIPPPPKILQTKSKLLFLIFGPLKVILQLWSLWLILGYRTRAGKWLLVQNPPSIPTLLIAIIISLVRNSSLVVDWHNFGYSILSMKLGWKHPLVVLSAWYEATLGRWANLNFTVTDAMAKTLKNPPFRVTNPILTLHDRPPKHFQPLSSDQRSSFLAKLPETTPYSEAIVKGSTKLLVSSTSWTPDEDFSLLLSALEDYCTLANKPKSSLPEILAIITGKGPQKDHYLSAIAKLKEQRKLSHVTVLTAWLSTADYASLLGAADLGVSLHTSSSGVDLPMKVVDMFGAGLPVVGWSKFEAWPELVKEGINGRGFGSVEQLTNALVDLFSGDGKELQMLKDGAVQEGSRRWDDEWDHVAGRVLGLVG